MAEGGQESRWGNEDTVGIRALLVISFPSYHLCCCMQNWVHSLSLSFFCLSFQARISPQVIAQLYLIHWVTVAYGKQLYFLFAHHHPSAFTPRLAQQVHVRTPPPENSRWHMPAQAKTSGCVTWPLKDSQLAPSLSPATTALGYMSCGYNRPPHPLPTRGFCCFSATLIYGSAGRAAGTAGWLPSNSLTQSFTAYIESAGCVCMCTLPERCLLDSPADFFLQGQHRLGQASIMEE